MPRIIDQTLYNRIANSDPTLTELTFGTGGTDFFGSAPKIELNLNVPQQFANQPEPGKMKRTFSGKRNNRSLVPKALSHKFFYGNLQFSFLYTETVSPHSTAIGIVNYATERKGCGFEEIAEALGRNTSIKIIDLTSDNEATKVEDERDSRIILSAIKKHSGLTSLTLSTAPLGAEGFNMLCGILRSNSPPLKFLSIHSSDVVKDKGRLQQLFDTVQLNNTLEMVQIEYPNSSPYAYIEYNEQWRSGSSSAIQKIGTHSDTDIEKIINQIRELVRKKLAARQTPTTNGADTVADLRSIVAQQQQQIQALMQALHLQNSGKPLPPGTSSSTSQPK